MVNILVLKVNISSEVTAGAKLPRAFTVMFKFQPVSFVIKDI